MITPSQLKKRLQQLVNFYGSQSKLAKSLGINQSQISRYLKGTRNPSKALRKKIFSRFSYKEKIRKSIEKYTKRIKAKYKKGVKADGRNFVRFDFSMKRLRFTSELDLPEIFKKFIARYNRVQDKEQQIKAQRLGVSIATTEKVTEDIRYYSKKAKREYTKKKENIDFITTIIYARNENSKKLMFTDLYDKMKKYIMGTLNSVSLHEEQQEKTINIFYVFFEDESVEY